MVLGLSGRECEQAPRALQPSSRAIFPKRTGVPTDGEILLSPTKGGTIFAAIEHGALMTSSRFPASYAIPIRIALFIFLAAIVA